MLKEKKYDLILVGTGFASSFFLKKYLEKSSSNKKVLVLERGHQYPYSDRLRQRQGDKISYQHSLKNFSDTIANPDSAKPWVFDPNFGGSSNCWWGTTLRFLPNDFNLKTLYNKGADWPVKYDDLEAYYTEAENIMSVSGPQITPFERSGAYPLPAHALSTVDNILQKRYGKHLYFGQPTARASRAIGNRGMCCSNYTCSVCPVNAKFTIENTLGYLYQDPRVELHFNAQVYSLLLQGDHVKKVMLRAEGKNIETESDIVALGANAIFNAHIVLAAGDSNALTGRGLCEQKGMFVNIHLEGLNNLGGSSAMAASGYMLYDGPFRSYYASGMLESHNGPFIRNDQGKWRQIARFKFVFEDLPNNNNRVELSEDFLKPSIHFKNESEYVENARRNLLRELNNLFGCLPVENIFPDDHFQETEYHILGTMRMGQNASDSVVDRNMIHHKYRNLFVLGGSSFPSIAAANPSLTIAALSLRSADSSF